jgi:8-oxo-dGTP pyrophosphatase MutT (NUDIX family)
MKMRLELIQQIEQFSSNDLNTKNQFLEFLKQNENCFDRELAKGHVTASGLIGDFENKKILLLHHKKLQKWLQPGGHCDGNPNTLSVAKKEIAEETGIIIPETLVLPIFDLDIHLIPFYKNIPAHYHYDVRYLFWTNSEIPIINNEESNELAWINIHNLNDYVTDESIIRMVKNAF